MRDLYTAYIETGKGKNKATSQTIPLPKDRLINKVRRSPFGNNKTDVLVTNMRTKKQLKLKKFQFRPSLRL